MEQLDDSNLAENNQLARQTMRSFLKKTFRRSFFSLFLILPRSSPALATKLKFAASIFQFCSIVSINILVIDLLSASVAHAACNSSGLTVTRISAPKFYIDNSITPQLKGQYVGYKITNNGNAYVDLWARLANFTGGMVTLAPNEDGNVHIGPLDSGKSTTVYFYLTANQTTEINQSHDLNIYTSNPSIGNPSSFCAENFSFVGVKNNPSVLDTIKASPNTVATVTTSPNPPEVGGKLVMTITGNTGQMGGDYIFSASPASLAGWQANILKLTSSKIEFLGPGNTGTFNDRLYLQGTADIPNPQETNYRATYTFKIQGTTGTPISVNPLNNISSGNPVKHTNTDTLTYLSLAPILPPKLNLTISSKTVSPTKLSTGGTVTYTVTFNNTQGTVDAVLDEITDTLPNNVSYVANSAKFDGVSIANSNISTTGNTLKFSGLYTVPTGSTSTLTYQATIPAANGTYVNSVIGKLGSVQVDTTTSTTDNAPAQATVTVASLIAPIIDLDGDNSSGAANNDFNTSYTLGGSAVKIADANTSTETLDTVITDSDSTQLSKAVITLTNNPTIVGDAFNINTTALSAIAGGAITADISVPNKITLNGNASLANYEAALELIEFRTTATNTTPRTITVQVTDTDSKASNIATTNIAINAPPASNLDYGDAPNSYRDAGHNIPTSPQLYLGKVAPDGEASTRLTSFPATGDDDDGNDDEDAFIALPNIPLVDPSITNLSLGRKYNLNVPVTNNTNNSATLHAWIDFNQNGKFEAEEYQTASIGTGQNSAALSWNIPLTTLVGDTYARFRLTSDNLTDKTGLLDPLNLGIDERAFGNATNGEVEDYPVSVSVPLFDYGDAPDANSGTVRGDYKTTESDGGPTHVVIQDPLNLLHLSLGNNIDGDNGSLQNVNADADDKETRNVDILKTILSNIGTGLNDEDGVTSFPALTATPGQTYTVPVIVRNNIPLLNAYVKGYIDFNQDGDFDDQGEKSATVTVPPLTTVSASGSTSGSSTSASGSVDNTGLRTVNLTFTIPAGVLPGDTYARFRLGSIQEIVESATGAAVSTNNGEVNNGEVEDYKIKITEGTNNGNTETTDYGDAPDSYKDAIHNLAVSPNLYLGRVPPDGEADTQLTSAPSAGDDDNGNDDEDAFVVLPNVPLIDPAVTSLSVGRIYKLTVPVTNNSGGNATLYAWIDFNQNGKFEAAEYQSASVASGQNSVVLNWDMANILDFLNLLNLPLTTFVGDTHARFRLTSDNLTDKTGLLDIANLGIDERAFGNATNGEVEDYPVSVSVPLFDYGDAPDRSTGTGKGNYQTTESDEGPTHVVIQDPLDLLHLSLGNNIDGDDGSLQNVNADADDLETRNVDILKTILSNIDTGLDDEDGVTSFPALTATPGQTYTVPVIVRNNIPLLNAYVKGYIDFNQDGDFDDQGEKSATVTVPSDLLTVSLDRIALDTSGKPRTFNLTFTTPAGIIPGSTYARIRLGSIQEIVESATGASISTNNGEVNNGEVNNGEIEDYGIFIAPKITSVGGRIINDTNYNGVLDGEETGRDNIKLKLFNLQNELIATTTTINGGFYNFDNIPSGQYYVIVETPNNTVLSPQGKSGPDGKQSDFNRLTNRTRPFNYTSGNPLAFNGAIAIDTDGDKIADVNEQGDRDGDNVPDSEEIDPAGFFYEETTGKILAGGSILVEGPNPNSVNLVDNGADGSYVFFAQDPGNYTITVNSPPGYEPSTICMEDTDAPFDPTGGLDPTSLGSGENGTTGFLVSKNCQTDKPDRTNQTINSFYLSFDLDYNDPIIINNNFPFKKISGNTGGSQPKLLLVKRITAVNPNRSDKIIFNSFVKDDVADNADNNLDWPDSDSDPNNSSNIYLRGAIEDVQINPGDEVEYTIYFLSNGNAEAKKIKICDVIPDRMTFVKDAYGVETGIALGLNNITLPADPNKFLSNLRNDDEGSFYKADAILPPNLCQKIDSNNNLVIVNGSNNNNGAIIIELDSLSSVTSPGQPTDSYGFVRFRARVK